MPNSYKYDVAISFLMHDMEVARSLYLRLRESLSVFFFERKQEEIAGRDGLDQFREPFLKARVSVVLYRPPWGEANWTGVERTAIGEACLKKGYANLFMVRMDPGCAMPLWVPKTHIYFDHASFSFDELVGGIKLKAIELGGKIEQMTADMRAEIYDAEHRYLIELDRFRNTSDGVTAMRKEIEAVFSEVDRKSLEYAAKGRGMRSASNPGRCVITNERVSIVAYWKQSGLPSLIDQALVIEEYDWYIAPPNERRRIYVDGEPHARVTTKYELELTRERQTVWVNSSDDSRCSSAALAEAILIRFFALDERVTEERVRRRY